MFSRKTYYLSHTNDYEWTVYHYGGVGLLTPSKKITQFQQFGIADVLAGSGKPM